jgi:FkbM family methyltransferase
MVAEKARDPGQQLYPGLYGEVVSEDVYGLREYEKSHAPPGVVFDIGANVGIFSRFARKVFPGAKIVAVEPDGVNFERLEAFSPSLQNKVFVQAAIGNGPVWKFDGAINGAHETYLTVCPGFTEAFFGVAPRAKPTTSDSVSLGELVESHTKTDAGTLSYLVKIDCEGNENAVFADESSLAALAKADYFAIEIHTAAAHGGEPMMAVRQLLVNTMEKLRKTHDVVVEHVIWRGTRRDG